MFVHSFQFLDATQLITNIKFNLKGLKPTFKLDS